jgi:UDP-N-acetylmuramate: L-alanyl-gamma-D-glutamyl-meso-diaminopimelate ligase
MLMGCDADTNIAELIPQVAGRFQHYGFNSNSKWYIGQVETEPPFTKFQVFKGSDLFGWFQMPMVGGHNILNALAAIAVVDYVGVPQKSILKGLAAFQGIKRRQEIRGINKGVTVIDDFAHHPTAVKETIHAIKEFYPIGNLIAVFEPRTNTSMRNIFQDIYPTVFDEADVICIRKPPLLKKIPEKKRFSSKQLVADLQKRGLDAHYFADTSDIVDFVIKIVKSGDVVLVMSNGGFDNIHLKLLKRLE